MKKSHKRSVVFIAASFLAMVGTYNAVMINSNSSILGESFGQKRLDEILGIVITGRAPAVTRQWSKIHKSEAKSIVATNEVKVVNSASNDNSNFQPALSDEPQSAIQDELNLKLVDVTNPAKWQSELKDKQFSGSIVSNRGIIESLTASLPQGIKIDIAFSELTGNTFEYDYEGEVYQGLMYQVDQGSFMVTLNNGPLEGTRMRFAGETMDAEELKTQNENYLAETHKVEVGTFGTEAEVSANQDVQAEEVAEASTQEEAVQTANAETVETNSFNFNQQI